MSYLFSDPTHFRLWSPVYNPVDEWGLLENFRSYPVRKQIFFHFSRFTVQIALVLQTQLFVGSHGLPSLP
jgi:hypothetical protein